MTNAPDAPEPSEVTPEVAPEETLTQFAELLRERLALLGEAFQEIARTLAPHIVTISQAVATVYRQLYDVISTRYAEAGMPYGANNDGMWRWLRELREIEQLEQRAESLRAQHRDLATFRAKLVEQRERERDMTH